MTTKQKPRFTVVPDERKLTPAPPWRFSPGCMDDPARWGVFDSKEGRLVNLMPFMDKSDAKAFARSKSRRSR